MDENLDLSGVPMRLSHPVYRYHQFQGATNNCGPACVAIAGNALRDNWALDTGALAKEMNALAFEWRPFPHLVVPRVPNWATFPWGIVYHLRKRRFRAQWNAFGSMDRLAMNLNADRLTMVVIGEPWRRRNWAYSGWAHVKILYGRLPGRGLLFVDPGYPRSSRPSRIEYHGLFWQQEEEFARQWANMGRVYVEVELGLHDG